MYVSGIGVISALYVSMPAVYPWQHCSPSDWKLFKCKRVSALIIHPTYWCNDSICEWTTPYRGSILCIYMHIALWDVSSMGCVNLCVLSASMYRSPVNRLTIGCGPLNLPSTCISQKGVPSTHPIAWLQVLLHGCTLLFLPHALVRFTQALGIVATCCVVYMVQCKWEPAHYTHGCGCD